MKENEENGPGPVGDRLDNLWYVRGLIKVNFITPHTLIIKFIFTL